VWITKASESEPLMKCRKQWDDIETGACRLPWDESGGCLPAARAVSGVKAARAWSGLLDGTCEPVVLAWRLAAGWAWEGELQAVQTVRGGVPMRDTGADRPVVAVKPGNAGGAKGAGHPGLLGGQPDVAGGAR
jgi:hypothetical protein